MKKTIFTAVLACLVLLTASLAMAQDGTKTTIKLKGATCQVSELILRPMFAPAEMKDSDKAFMVRFSYKLNDGVTSDVLSVLYDEGRFVAPDGNSYKAGASIVNDTLYSLVVAVPKDVDVETLTFEFRKQTVPLK